MFPGPLPWLQGIAHGNKAVISARYKRLGKPHTLAYNGELRTWFSVVYCYRYKNILVIAWKNVPATDETWPSLLRSLRICWLPTVTKEICATNALLICATIALSSESARLVMTETIAVSWDEMVTGAC